MGVDCSYVFVYGTLRRGFENPGRAILEEHARFLDEATTHGQLHDLGAYPAMLETPEDPGPVRGEAHELVREPERALERLDRYEGAGGRDPLPYERRKVPVELDTGDTIEAWTYVWTERPPEGSRIEGGDWVAHVEERA